jgi:hypothetical protein
VKLECGNRLAGSLCPPRFHFWRNLSMAFLLAMATPAAWCQAVPAEQLQIKVIKGEGDVHRPGDKTGTVIELQVLNEVELPQPDAEVELTAEPDGPSVRLEKETIPLSVKVKSNPQGVARVDGILGNKLKGPVTIHVAASFEGKKGVNTINQVNESGPVLNRTRGLILAGVLAATGIILYERFKPGPPTATINSPTSSTTGPQFSISIPRLARSGR